MITYQKDFLTNPNVSEINAWQKILMYRITGSWSLGLMVFWGHGFMAQGLEGSRAQGLIDSWVNGLISSLTQGFVGMYLFQGSISRICNFWWLGPCHRRWKSLEIENRVATDEKAFSTGSWKNIGHNLVLLLKQAHLWPFAAFSAVENFFVALNIRYWWFSGHNNDPIF